MFWHAKIKRATIFRLRPTRVYKSEKFRVNTHIPVLYAHMSYHPLGAHEYWEISRQISTDDRWKRNGQINKQTHHPATLQRWKEGIFLAVVAENSQFCYVGALPAFGTVFD